MAGLMMTVKDLVARFSKRTEKSGKGVSPKLRRPSNVMSSAEIEYCERIVAAVRSRRIIRMESVEIEQGRGL